MDIKDEPEASWRFLKRALYYWWHVTVFQIIIWLVLMFIIFVAATGLSALGM